jgi:EamA domain-containing membrane protein RarD
MPKLTYKLLLAHLSAAAFAVGALSYGISALLSYLRIRVNPSDAEGLDVYSTILSAAWALGFVLCAAGSECTVRSSRSSRWLAITSFLLGVAFLSNSWWGYSWAVALLSGLLRSA